MRSMGVVFENAGSARKWLTWLASESGASTHYVDQLQYFSPLDSIVIQAGKKAAQYAPTHKERGRSTALFVRAIQHNALSAHEVSLNPRLSQNYLPYRFVATTANTIQHAFGREDDLLSPFALAAAFQGCGAPTSTQSAKRSLFTPDGTTAPKNKRPRVPLDGGPLVQNLLVRVEEAGAGEALREAAHVSRMNCKSGSKHRNFVAPALNHAAILSGHVGTPAPSLARENELLRRRQPHV